MAIDSVTDSKRIARNTIALYFRALVVMIVGLFTSRVLLQTLGVTDVGIYNAVGGIVSLFGFITSSLSNSTSRFISIDLGKGDQQCLNKTFANVKYIYGCLAVLILLLGETIGLWFLYNYLVIPAERFNAALWVYHYSVLSAMIGVMCIPYGAAVVAHERMSAFAYISLIDVFYKLFIIYLLNIIPYDNLIVYATFYFVAGIINFFIYFFYCRKRFIEVRVKARIDKEQFREIFSFSAWVIGGNFAWVANNHGLNLMLNIFGGPVVNAARAVALQVQGVTSQFVTNFQSAVNPQITKTYAREEYQRMHNLIVWSSKFSFFLLLILCLPVISKTFFILDLWLVDVPEYTEFFLKLVLVLALLKTLSNPIWTAVLATGHLRKYQLYDNILQFLILPTCYIALKFFAIPFYSVYVIIVFYEMILIPVRLYIVLPLINYPTREYVYNILIPIIVVSVLSSLMSFIFCFFINKSLMGNIVVMICVFVSTIIVTWFFGLKESERNIITKRIILAKSKI